MRPSHRQWQFSIFKRLIKPIHVEISAVDGYGELKENAVPAEKLENPYNVISYKNKLLMVA
uniref:hypothetical protein n=1 Tax=Paenibacillus luteus TaxID=2545753 RepID=UPI0011444946